MSEVPVFCLANSVVRYCNQRDIPVSNLKLQKLVYYVEAFFLALNNESLFKDDFEAWVHGPVVPKLYDKYKGQLNIEHDVEGCFFKFSSTEEEDLFTGILGAYAEEETCALEARTHQEKPWQEVREGLDRHTHSDKTICRDTMAQYYLEMFHRLNEQKD